MKNLLLFALTLLFGLGLQAQKIQDATFTDCNGNTESVYGVLATGKVLVIASKGFDCGICKSHAANYESFIAQNKATIAGWGAMIFLYQSGTPTCSDVNNWNSTYGWNEVFSFVDTQKDYFLAGTPRYYVVNPADSTIVYNGGNFNAMQQAALQYASGLDVEENELSDVKVYQSNGNLVVSSSGAIGNTMDLSVYNIVGQREISWSNVQKENGQFEFSMDNYLAGGMYLLQISVEGKEVTKKIIWRP